MSSAQHPPAERTCDDAERQRTADLVVEAAGAGVLQLDEADEALTTVYAARSGTELTAVVERHLPPSWLAQREQDRGELEVRADAQAGFRRHLTAYVAAMSGMTLLWLVVGLNAGGWYPWPVWPALGWGIGICSNAREAYGRPGPVQQRPAAGGASTAARPG